MEGNDPPENGQDQDQDQELETLPDPKANPNPEPEKKESEKKLPPKRKPDQDPDKVPPKTVIEVTSVNLNIPLNSARHHTQDYVITRDEQNPILVLRRGQPFSIELTFDREYDPDFDEVQIEFFHDAGASEANADTGAHRLSSRTHPRTMNLDLIARIDIEDSTCYMEERDQNQMDDLKTSDPARYTRKRNTHQWNTSHWDYELHSTCWHLTLRQFLSEGVEHVERVEEDFARKDDQRVALERKRSASYVQPAQYQVYGSKTRVLEIKTPADIKIGRWSFAFRRRLKHKTGPYKRSQTTSKILFLFNPWCYCDEVSLRTFTDQSAAGNILCENAGEEGTYIEDVPGKEEYMMNPTGLIFIGNKNQVESRPWVFAQFEKQVLEFALECLPNDINKSEFKKMNSCAFIGKRIVDELSKYIHIDYKDQGDRQDSRTSSDRVITQAPGTMWMLDQIRKANTQKHTCRTYDYILSAVVTSLLRALGIPSRCCTGYDTIHDPDVGKEVLYVWGGSGELRAQDGGKRWLFHVWNEMFCRRTDHRFTYFANRPRNPYKGFKFDLRADSIKVRDRDGKSFTVCSTDDKSMYGWQVIDVTPTRNKKRGREVHPFISVKGIQNFTSARCEATQCFRNKLHSKIMHQVYSDSGRVVKLEEPNRCAAKIITNTPRCWEYDENPDKNKVPVALVKAGIISSKNREKILNITWAYKAKYNPKAKPNRDDDVVQVNKFTKSKAMYLEIMLNNEQPPVVGEDFSFIVRVTNLSPNRKLKLKGYCRVQTVNAYGVNGQVIGFGMQDIEHRSLALAGLPGSTYSSTVTCTWEDYKEYLQLHYIIQVVVAVFDEETQECSAQIKEYQLLPPPLILKLFAADNKPLEKELMVVPGHARGFMAPISVYAKEPLRCRVSFTNPLPIELTQWVLRIEGTRIQHFEINGAESSTIAPGAVFQQDFQVTVDAFRCINAWLVVTFHCNELTSLVGSIAFLVSSTSASRRVSSTSVIELPSCNSGRRRGRGNSRGGGRGRGNSRGGGGEKGRGGRGGAHSADPRGAGEKQSAERSSSEEGLAKGSKNWGQDYRGRSRGRGRGQGRGGRGGRGVHWSNGGAANRGNEQESGRSESSSSRSSSATRDKPDHRGCRGGSRRGNDTHGVRGRGSGRDNKRGASAGPSGGSGRNTPKPDDKKPPK